MSENLKPERAAEYVDSSVGTLANWRVRGIGPAYVKQGRFIRYPKSELDRWLGEQLKHPQGVRESA